MQQELETALPAKYVYLSSHKASAGLIPAFRKKLKARASYQMALARLMASK